MEDEKKSNLRYDIIVLGIILLFAVSMRAYRLGVPPKQVFDECYYAKAANDYLSLREDSNWVHPPLGKLLIASGILVHRGIQFVTSSVGITSNIRLGSEWRMASLIFGLLMIILVYFFALKMFKSRYIATVSAFLLSIEFLHFVESRIAMLDMFLSFFMLAGFYTAYCYIEKEGGYNNYLIITAALFGLSTAIKWSGIFGALGAFTLMVFLKQTDAEESRYGELLESSVKKGFIKRIYFKMLIRLPRTLKIAAIFFLSGLILQFMSYIPYFLTGGTFKKLYGFYKGTLEFHYHQKWSHPYLSRMWTWPLMIRPIWYLYDTIDKKINGIIAMGCPVFWWGFFVFLIELVIITFYERKKEHFFLLVGYFSPYIFWIISNKGGFFYYMTPCVAWMCIITAYVLECWRNLKIGRIMGWVYLLTLIVFFFFFYPILASYPIPHHYYKILMWRRSWI